VHAAGAPVTRVDHRCIDLRYTVTSERQAREGKSVFAVHQASSGHQGEPTVNQTKTGARGSHDDRKPFREKKKAAKSKSKSYLELIILSGQTVREYWGRLSLPRYTTLQVVAWTTFSHPM
jgi:hypothetical protein